MTAGTVSRAGTPGLSDIIVDGERRARMVDLEWQGNVLTIEADQARAAGLPVPAEAGGKISLASLGLASFRFDPLSQTLVVALMRKSDGGNLIDLTHSKQQEGQSAPLTWARLDYDVTASRTPQQAAAGGAFAAALGRGNVYGATTITATASSGGHGQVQRLDSFVQWLIPSKGVVATGGDVVTAGSRGQRPVRIGGIQIASDFALRPDLVTLPLPSFTGQVSVPTGVDLLINGQRSEVGKVDPGEFTVRNVPASLGRGTVSLIVKDALGRETVQTVRFYASTDLLTPGLQQYALNAGFVRRRYGLVSNDYGPFAASGFFRRGLSRYLTAEVSGETARGLVNVGARADVALANVALASFEPRFSRTRTGQTGTMLTGAIESVSQKLSARLAFSLPSGGYRDAASELGDPAPQRTLVGQISYALGDNRLQFSAGRFTRLADPLHQRLAETGTVANAAFGVSLGKRMSANFAAVYRTSTGERRSLAASVSLSVRLGRDRFAGGSASYFDDRKAEFSAYYRKPESIVDPIGYALEASTGERTRALAELTWRPHQGVFQAQVLHEDGATSVRGNARGTLIVAGGGVFARTQSENSYALVRAGNVGGITVMRENRLAGKTNGKGLLLIDDIPGYVPISYDIDADKLPADVLARRTQLRVTIPRRAVGLVAMDVLRYVPWSIRLLGADGMPLPAGTMLVARPSGESIIVGFDGMAEINRDGPDRVFELDNGTGAICRFAIPAKAQASGEMPSFGCMPILVPTTLVKAGVDSGPIASASRR
ncbi:fimbria/pilus outer membrane usher protein [Parablastomonas sp. CN1-191]|uniref:fimbria/pilus outer membrane usher protein n=1 Tax=Parablastomonas sp. CN1-191 TaxID=3400908 RepID=UPI003BF8252D